MYNKHSPYLMFKMTCGPPCSSAIPWTTTICSAALSSYRQNRSSVDWLSSSCYPLQSVHFLFIHQFIYLHLSSFLSFIAVSGPSRSGSI